MIRLHLIDNVAKTTIDLGYSRFNDLARALTVASARHPKLKALISSNPKRFVIAGTPEKGPYRRPAPAIVAPTARQPSLLDEDLEEVAA